MATQASAITFLSMPGQAYQDGMGFIQFYFGLPIAMIILSAVIVPIYYRLKVYTAYEYLETRFDRKTRQLVALLFLLSRGLGAGISIYAPAIVLSTVLGWPLGWTNLAIGAGVIVYTVSGGTRVVSRTQTWQMVVMLGGMAAAFGFVLHRLPPAVSLDDALAVGGALGKMKLVDFAPRVDTRYTFWSGITGGLFVQLAYFGTDQSQVQRYLTGSPLAESRLGLMFNGLVKLPMQFVILVVGPAALRLLPVPPAADLLQPARAGARRGERARRRAARRRGRVRAAPSPTRAATATALVDARHGGDGARIAAAEARAARRGRAHRRARASAPSSSSARAARAPRPRTRTTSSCASCSPTSRRGWWACSSPSSCAPPCRRRRARSTRSAPPASSTSTSAACAPARDRRALPARRQAVHRRLGRARRRASPSARRCSRT